jgi:hypothetical protein
MSGTRTRYARTVLARALTVACAVLLCLLGVGPAASDPAAAVAETRPGSSAPAEPGGPAEGQSDPAADPEVRAAVRTVARVLPGTRRLPPVVFEAPRPVSAPAPAPGTADRPVAPLRALRSVVLRC